MEIDGQVMVGSNLIVTFGRVDVELTKDQAEKLKVLLVDALERGENNSLIHGINKNE